ncbi:MAG: aromatic ring-hydroxylating dioxygenase subunit alpha [Polyangiaceae bacterium]|nr:aromatic ring-hydroxylating dioxygenase subunit alpha [Polyangiaceae bacterium]
MTTAGANRPAEGLLPTAGLVPQGKGHASVVRLREQWFIACLSQELRGAPLRTELMATPLVLFRDRDGKPAALLDRCPHRNVPLSLGSVADDGTLRCPYHGWRFDGAGRCRFVPSLTSQAEAKARDATALPVLEQDGFVWVYSAPTDGGAPPDKRPHTFAYLGAKDYTTVVQVVQAAGTMFSTLENALDVPHTAFLHRGLFRSESRGITITAKVERSGDRVQAEYVGEPRPPGLIGRILSPSGGIVTHFDRFILPSIAQVEYRIGSENHILVDSVMTPVTDFLTRVYAVVSFRARLPHFVIKPFVKPLALRVFQQDARILEQQTQTIHTFGGEQFASTEIDVLGRHIWRLLRAAEQGDAVGDERVEIPLVV